MLSLKVPHVSYDRVRLVVPYVVLQHMFRQRLRLKTMFSDQISRNTWYGLVLRRALRHPLAITPLAITRLGTGMECGSKTPLQLSHPILSHSLQPAYGVAAKTCNRYHTPDCLEHSSNNFCNRCYHPPLVITAAASKCGPTATLHPYDPCPMDA